MTNSTKNWKVTIIEDDDKHLNIYIEANNVTDIHEIETGQGDGKEGEQLALRFTTDKIEKEYKESL